MITNIDFQQKRLIQELYKLQKASYIIEAKLIDYYEIPPLVETFEQLLECRESFLGYFENDKLAGAVSFTIESDELTICRMVVHPNYFRKGISERLLKAVEEQNGEIATFKVSTGKDNIPAKKLYQKNGYRLVNDIEVVPGLLVSNFIKEM